MCWVCRQIKHFLPSFFFMLSDCLFRFIFLLHSSINLLASLFFHTAYFVLFSYCILLTCWHHCLFSDCLFRFIFPSTRLGWQFFQTAFQPTATCTWCVWWLAGITVCFRTAYVVLLERDVAQRYSVRSWCGGSSDRSFMGWTHWATSRSSQCSTTGVTKAVVCVILSVGWCI